jgi:protein-tyrosine phosphatase
MIDLHCHLLPDWDDGPESWEEVEKMVEQAAEDGIQKVCLTPHIFRFSRYHDDLQVLNARFEDFFQRFSSFSQMEFYRGAEVFVHPDLVSVIEEKKLSVNGSEYVFVEFPSDQVPAGVRELFYQMQLAGYTPIISHPERNTVFGQQPELLYDLVNRGCLVQLTAMSLTGGFGHEVKKYAEQFLKHNLVHLLATDAHDSSRRKPVLSQAVEQAAKIVGQERAEAMVSDVPQAILDNRIVPDLGQPISPGGEKKKFFSFLRK